MGKSFITWSSLFTSSVTILACEKTYLDKIKEQKRANLNKKKVNDIVYSLRVLNNLLLRLL